MTLKVFVEDIIRLIQRGYPSRDFKIDEREIARHTKSEASRLVRARSYEDRMDGDVAIDGYFLGYYNGLTVQNDTTKVINSNYAVIPVDYIQMPYNAGIRSVRYLDTDLEDYTDIIPLPSEAKAVIWPQLKRFGATGNDFWYEVLGDRIYFHENCGQTLLDRGITSVDAVIFTQDVGLSDRLPVPQDLIPILQRNVLEILGYPLATEDDLLNDNDQQ